MSGWSVSVSGRGVCEWVGRLCEWVGRLCEWVGHLREWVGRLCEWVGHFCECMSVSECSEGVWAGSSSEIWVWVCCKIEYGVSVVCVG